MTKKKIAKKTKEDKEEKALNIWIPVGVTVGIIIGLVLSLQYNDYIYLGSCAAGGLLAGTMIGLFFAEDEITFKTEPTKKKNHKK